MQGPRFRDSYNSFEVHMVCPICRDEVTQTVACKCGKVAMLYEGIWICAKKAKAIRKPRADAHLGAVSA